MKKTLLIIFSIAIIFTAHGAAAQTRLDMALPEIADIDPGAGIASFIKYIFVFGLGAIALLRK